MKIIMRNNIFNKIVLSHYVLLMIFCEINGRMLKNLINIEKEDNHVSFNHFFPLHIEEKLISDQQKVGSCGTCHIENDQHIHLNQKNDLSWYDRCFGKLNSCSVLKGSSGSDENPADCTGNCECVCYTEGLPDDKQQVDSVCLDPVYVNVSDHQVITGVRFTTVRNMLMLQIQAGRLQEEATISRGTNHWVSPARSCVKVAPIVHEKTSFAFDNITFPANYRITGLSLRKCVELWEYSGIKIKTMRNCQGDDFIFLTAYGTDLEKIFNGNSQNIIEGQRSGNLSLSGRHDYTKPNMEVPTKADKNDQQEKRGNYATFRSTKRISNNAIPIIPYISIKESAAKPTKPLVGIEMIYYGDDYHGGYISPVVYTQ